MLLCSPLRLLLLLVLLRPFLCYLFYMTHVRSQQSSERKNQASVITFIVEDLLAYAQQVRLLLAEAQRLSYGLHSLHGLQADGEHAQQATSQAVHHHEYRALPRSQVE